MRIYTVGDFKTNFSEILARISAGEEVAIAYGKKKEIVAYVVPRSKRQADKRPLGLLAGKATAEFHDDFKMTEEEFLGV